MSLGSALNSAYSGIVVSSRRAEVTSNNIANATTPGFVQRTVEVSAQVVGGQGQGAIVERVVLASNPGLTAERRLADAAAAGAAERAQAGQTLARLIGEPEDPGALSERYEALETALRRISDDPGSTNLQLDVIAKSQDLIDGFSQAQDSLVALRSQTDRSIGLLVERVNTTLEAIHELNGDISKEIGIGGDVSALIAQREGLVDDISEIIPIKTYEGPNQRLLLTTDTGYSLVSTGRANVLDFTPARAVTAADDLIGGAPGALGELSLGGQVITPPTSPIISTGRLAALFEVRDVTTVQFQNRIDALAQDLVNRFEEVDAGALGLFIDPAATRADDLYELGLNLPAAATGTAGTSFVETVAYMDDTGVQQQLTLTFTTTATANEYALSIDDSATDAASNPISEVTLLFDAAGPNAGFLNTVTDVTGPTFGGTTAGALTLTSGDGATPLTISLGVAGAAGPLSMTANGFGPANPAPTSVGLAGRLALNPDVDPAQGGNLAGLRDGIGAANTGEAGYNAHTLALLNAFTATREAQAGSDLQGTYSAFDLVAGVSSIVSTETLSAEQSSALRATRQQTLETAELSELGVDLDFELQELNLIQTAYNANARVLQTIDEMFQRLLEI